MLYPVSTVFHHKWLLHKRPHILQNICSLKNEKLRNKCMLEFSEEFFKVMTEINKNNKVVFLNIPTIKIEIKKNEISEDIQKNSQIFWEKYCKEMNS